MTELSSLQNFFVECKPSEKLVQLIRIMAHERQHHGSAKFIIYFATCACVDYFYRVSTIVYLSGLQIKPSPTLDTSCPSS